MSKKKPKVFFGSIQQGRLVRYGTLASKLDKIIELLDFSTIDKKDKVAIKMHLGYREGYQTIPVFFVRRIVNAVKEIGGWPFVTDNPTSVYNAVDRGYTAETCGCPIIPVAGVKDGYVKTAKVGHKTADILELGGVLSDADVLIDLAHIKGHGTCGFGGAFKNIALGGFSGPSRWQKIHAVFEYNKYWDPKKCTPEHAKKLVESCQYNALRYNEEKHKLQLIDHECVQCFECLEVDKEVGSLQIKQENFSDFQEMMAVAAKEIINTFDEKKRFYINIALNITTFCDCLGMPQPNIMNDVGILGSRDIVAIDTASLDLIAKEKIIEKNIPLFLKHVNLDPKADLHPFQRLHGPFKDPYLVTKFGEELGLGNSNYKLVEVLPPKDILKREPEKIEYEVQPSFF